MYVKEDLHVERKMYVEGIVRHYVLNIAQDVIHIVQNLKKIFVML